MAHVFKQLLSWPNNKHYLVMYSGLFYNCWQCEICERTKGMFFECHRSAVWEMPSWLFSYKFQLFSSTDVHLRVMSCFIFCLLNLAGRILCVVRFRFFFLWYGPIVLVMPWQAFIDQPSFTFDFHLDFPFLAIKLSSVYLLFALWSSHQPYTWGYYVRLVLVNSVYHTYFMMGK